MVQARNSRRFGAGARGGASRRSIRARRRSLRPPDSAGADAVATPPVVPRPEITIGDIPDAVFATDLENRITHWTDSAAALFGFTAAEAVGRPFGELLPFRMDHDADEHELTATIRAGKPWRGQGTVRLRDGSELWIESTVKPLSAAGAIVGSVSVSRDMTHPIEAERALRGIAAVGQLLASHGPSAAALDDVLGILLDHMGYRHLCLLLAEGDHLRIGAARNLGSLPETIPLDRGIVGRVARTGEAAWVRDVREDRDYYAASPGVCSEIAVPLQADGMTIGVLDIEATADAPLAEHDLRLAHAVAGPLAAALLLGREQQALAERARLLAGLSEFAQATSAILQPDRLVPALMQALARLFPGDVMTLTTLDRDTKRYVLRAERGVDESVVGEEVRLGDGPVGRAIEARAFIGPVTLHRDDYWSRVRDLIPQDSLVSVTVPLMRNELVLGAISIGRANLRSPFSDTECEVMRLLGAQTALALANADLHQEVSELAIHDGLTGLYNRRHFDASLDLIFARWRRMRGKASIAAIMFDLDHFGRFNKEYGHQAGDAVLRSFAGLLHERLRSSDLVARYGGEEFVVILEDCAVAEAVRVAEEVRSGLEQRVIEGPLGKPLHARVSAGCAEIDPADPTKEALLRTADVALSMAKRSGRNRVVAA